MILTIRLLCVLAPLLLLSAAGHHPFHTSVTDMRYTAKQRGFEISVRIFTDDLETALTRANGGRAVHLGTTPATDQLLERYIRAHFVVATGPQTRKTYHYLGHETEADAQWIYLELPFAEPVRNLVIQQNVLTETFPDQANLLNLHYGEQTKTMVFRAGTPVQPAGLE
jgi:hypothetical protein